MWQSTDRTRYDECEQRSLATQCVQCRRSRDERQCVLAVRRLVYGPEAEGLFTLFGIAFFLMGVLLFGLGVVGEYVGRIYLQVRHRPRYVVGEALGSTRHCSV